MDRARAYSDAPWEQRVGDCRALRAGQHIYVTGTVARGADGRPHGGDDGEAQARRCLETIERAIAELGAGREHIVRTRMFVTEISRWEEFGRAHAQFFGEHHSVTTMVEVSALIGEGYLIEIEADAVLG